MARQLVNEKTLQAYLETELHKSEACNGYRVARIVKLQTPDAEGCNWSPRFVLDSIGPGDRGAGVAESIVAEARKDYNLE